MPQKSDNDFKGKYPYVRVGTLVSMHITDILFQGRNVCTRGRSLLAPEFSPGTSRALTDKLQKIL